MANKRWLSLVTTMLLLGMSLIASGTAQAVNSAQGVMLAYYTDINLKDYHSAYNLWQSPPQSYTSFANGFSLTDHVDPYLGALQSSTIAGELGRIPVVLLGYNTNGTVGSYFGCFTISTTYRITHATLHTISTNGIPDGASITNFMAINCFSVPATIPVTLLDTTSPFYGVFWSYFRAINQHDYTTAYSYWLHPIPGPKPNGQPAQDYRQTFSQFSAGYADTVWINAYPGVFDETGASAGHGYLNGLMPIVLVGQRSNGIVTAYDGCFVVGSFLNGTPGIVSGRFFTFLNGIPTGTQIVQHQNIDCTSLNLYY